MHHIYYYDWNKINSYNFNRKIYYICKLLQQSFFNYIKIHKLKTNKITLRYCTYGDLKIAFLDDYMVDSKIFVDYIDLYDKPFKCPIQLPLPTNNKEFNKLLTFLFMARSNKGFKQISNNYDYDKFVHSYKC